jgi:hypothetical protein
VIIGFTARWVSIVDGGTGLEQALAALWGDVPTQRCTVARGESAGQQQYRVACPPCARPTAILSRMAPKSSTGEASGSQHSGSRTATSINNYLHQSALWGAIALPVEFLYLCEGCGPRLARFEQRQFFDIGAGLSSDCW